MNDILLSAMLPNFLSYWPWSMPVVITFDWYTLKKMIDCKLDSHIQVWFQYLAWLVKFSYINGGRAEIHLIKAWNSLQAWSVQHNILYMYITTSLHLTLLIKPKVTTQQKKETKRRQVFFKLMDSPILKLLKFECNHNSNVLNFYFTELMLHPHETHRLNK